jgi:hypothetical protein
MSEWELRVSQRELHRMHVVRLTIEGRESVGKRAKLWGYLHADASSEGRPGWCHILTEYVAL